MVQFVVGKDRKRFLIHTELVSSIPSAILWPPIFEEIHEVVFSCCCEFVYSGDYSVPSPVYDPHGGQYCIGNELSKGSAKRRNPTNIILNFFHPEELYPEFVPIYFNDLTCNTTIGPRKNWPPTLNMTVQKYFFAMLRYVVWLTGLTGLRYVTYHSADFYSYSQISPLVRNEPGML